MVAYFDGIAIELYRSIPFEYLGKFFVNKLVRRKKLIVIYIYINTFMIIIKLDISNKVLVFFILKISFINKTNITKVHYSFYL